MMSEQDVTNEQFRPFDGETLKGWRAIRAFTAAANRVGPWCMTCGSRRAGHCRSNRKTPAHWFVEDGYIVGEQEFPGSGYGGYLITEETFGDFELVMEVRPDWPADTGIMVRRLRDDWSGFRSCSTTGKAGALADFSAMVWHLHGRPFKIKALRDDHGQVIGLQPDTPEGSQEPLQPEQLARLSYAANVQDFLKAWAWGEWNEMRIRVVGAMPVITTWVNGVKIAQLDTATMQAPNYDPDAILEMLGTRGHIALEVHDNDPSSRRSRWGHGAQCRWRNIRTGTWTPNVKWH
jgi:hypothetical protein